MDKHSKSSKASKSKGCECSDTYNLNHSKTECGEDLIDLKTKNCGGSSTTKNCK